MRSGASPRSSKLVLGDIINMCINFVVFMDNIPKSENDKHPFNKYTEKGCRVRTD